MKKLFSIILIIAVICLSGCRYERVNISEFIVTFDLCDGNINGDTTLIRIPVYEAMIIEYLPIPQRTDNDFSGWFTEKDGQGDEFTNTTHVYSNLVVYAYWVNNSE
jgi:hypothetical protein